MTRAVKVGIVAAGYVAAFLLATGATLIRAAATQGPDAQASSGMHAFADMVLFLAVFAFASTVPTGFALHLLRTVPAVWTALRRIVVTIAVTGVAALIVYGAERMAPTLPVLPWVSIFGVLRLITAPLLGVTWLPCAFFAPDQRSRWTLAGASAAEFLLGGIFILALFIQSVR